MSSQVIRVIRALKLFKLWVITTASNRDEGDSVGGLGSDSGSLEIFLHQGSVAGALGFDSIFFCLNKLPHVFFFVSKRYTADNPFLHGCSTRTSCRPFFAPVLMDAAPRFDLRVVLAHTPVNLIKTKKFIICMYTEIFLNINLDSVIVNA